MQGYHIVPVVDHDTTGELPWLASTFIPGIPLHTALTAHGPLPLPAVFQLVGCTARALSAIHTAGVVHRDLKPSNILLGPTGPYVIDFGIARAADATQLTQSGGLIGTPQYMSPEHALGERVGPATDVFSLGLIAAVAATGRHPYGDGGAITIAAQIANTAHRPPDLGSYPEELRVLLERCLTPEPAERISTQELAARCQDAAGRTLSDFNGWLPEPLRADITRREAAAKNPPPPAAPTAAASAAPPPMPSQTPLLPSAAPQMPSGSPQPTPLAPQVPPSAGQAQASPQAAAHPNAAPDSPAYGYPAAAPAPSDHPAYHHPAAPGPLAAPGYGYPSAPGGYDPSRQFGSAQNQFGPAQGQFAAGNGPFGGGQSATGELSSVGGPGGAPGTVVAGGSGPGPDRPRRRWRMALLAAVLVIAVGAGAGTAVWVLGKDKSKDDSSDDAGQHKDHPSAKAPAHSPKPSDSTSDSETPGTGPVSAPPSNATYTPIFKDKTLTIRSPQDFDATDVDLDEPKLDTKDGMDNKIQDIRVTSDEGWQFFTTVGKTTGSTAQDCVTGAETDALPSEVSGNDISQKNGLISEGDHLCTITQDGNLAMFEITEVLPGKYSFETPTVSGKVTLWKVDG